LEKSYLWTWDHSTNWCLDDPGVVNFGCDNRYLKRPETFVEDYRRVVDFAAGLGIGGIVAWGFLRDSHGGIDAGKRVADYAASRGVALMPGIGTTHYGGVYYEGDHPYCIDSFLRDNPEARMIGEDGQPLPASTCPSHPAFGEWLAEGIRWLFDEFAIGGANLENGDFMVCHCQRCNAHRDSWPADEPEFYRLQAMSYVRAVECIEDRLDDHVVSWATYTGFVPGGDRGPGAHMLCDRPLLVDRANPRSFGQWTLTQMVRHPSPSHPDQAPLPLTAYLDDGAPRSALDLPQWPSDLKPPTARSVGYLHQGSQWHSHIGRYDLAVSSIKEACLRAYRAGMQGAGIHGEMSPLHVPCALNYLALSHFVHWPEDSLRGFGRRTLGEVFGSEEQGEAFAEHMAHWDAGKLSDARKNDIERRRETLRLKVAGGSMEALEGWRFWHWLGTMTGGGLERHTVSIL
jgi:hypothetical protein